MADTWRVRPGRPDDLPFLREMLYAAACWDPGRPQPSLDEALADPAQQPLPRRLGPPRRHGGRRRPAGFPAISLSVEPTNPAALLYERVGFRRVGESGGSWTMRADLLQP